MKLTTKIITFIIFVAALAACDSQSYVISPFRNILFVNFEEIRSYGVEVTEGEKPDGTTTIGPYDELVCFGRSKKSVVEKQESKSFSNTPVFKEKFVYTGSQDTDLKTLNSNLAQEIKTIGGDGIAKLKVEQLFDTYVNKGSFIDYSITYPVYRITGIIYKYNR